MSETVRNPKNLHLPEGFNWPKPVQKEIALWDKAFKEWAEVSTTQAEKEEAVSAAKVKDAKALVTAVAERMTDPGTKNTDKAERELVYWEEAKRQARKFADVQASKVWKLILENAPEIIREACRRAKEGASQFDKDMAEVVVAGERAITERSKAYAGLRFVARICGPELSFDPSFPLDGSVRVPKTHENRVWALVALLERLWITDDGESVA